MHVVINAFMVVVLILSCGAASASESVRKPVSELPEIVELPYPFKLSDGSSVRTPEDWSRRRTELKSLFEDYMYGHLPPKPDKFSIEPGKETVNDATGVTLREYTFRLEHGGQVLPVDFLIALPANASATEKLPVIIQGGFGRRPLPPGWPPLPPPAERLKAFTDRGYAVAEVDLQQFAPDNRERARTGGVYQLFGDQIDCGALMAWAWGMHRVLDALASVPEIDTAKAIVTGHSRYGKAALVAGAYDERIALTVPSHSGCAGTAPYRFIYGNSEQLHNIVGAFPFWFRPDFNEFVDNVNRLPVDQHLLKALVAPRALLDTEGTEDAWTNPQGAQLTHVAAKKVYDFLGAGDKISIRYREVGHIPSNEDLMDYADHVFSGQPLSEEFGKLPYPAEPRGFHWESPN